MADHKWHYAVCDCGNDTYTRPVRLRWHETGGIVEELAQYQCRLCGTVLDITQLELDQQIKLKQAELDEITNRRNAGGVRTTERANGGSGLSSSERVGYGYPDHEPAHVETDGGSDGTEG